MPLITGTPTPSSAGLIGTISPPTTSTPPAPGTKSDGGSPRHAALHERAEHPTPPHSPTTDSRPSEETQASTPGASPTPRADRASRTGFTPPTVPARPPTPPARAAGAVTAAAKPRRQDPTAPGHRSRWRTGDFWIRLATVTAVLGVAGIAAVVSYRHMRAVAILHGEDPTNSAIIPLSVDGLIVAASMTMLADSRAHRRRSWLAYTLLALASAASLAANVMHAQPDLAARVIAAWPSAALIGAYELLTAQIRAAVSATAPQRSRVSVAPADSPAGSEDPSHAQPADSTVGSPVADSSKTADEIGRPSPQPAKPGSKKERLAQLLADLSPDDPRSVYALAKDLAPLIGLHEGTARRYIPHLRL
ncbi:conserved membrane hypothetical protein [Frankia canadensis]|uniref:DUF2637 domain-containing protein n=1 Tax=Frankia canadensis TaxID=1836972 RepID=A0A2I2L193_9ACTN|nr:DUF2637 domain-containing protein [Frankia canadensis]SNQ51684.1 conserved membrane hypothetical protein [Frankia canadensis]SOU58974.1 conserved membrane hypothetical protein [Frankia canadensis]